MDPYIKDLSYVIQNCVMQNTYKMVWIRSIVENCFLHPDRKLIHFVELAPKIFGYYWNQTIFLIWNRVQMLRDVRRVHQIVIAGGLEVGPMTVMDTNPFSFHGSMKTKLKFQSRPSVPGDSDLGRPAGGFLKVGKVEFDLYDLGRGES